MSIFIPIAIEIGFNSRTNTVREPDDGEIASFSEVMITKNISSEQTFVLDLEVTPQGCVTPVTPSATSRSDNVTLKDFDLLTATSDVMFLPQQQTIPINVVVYGDNRLEGRECFSIAISNSSLTASFSLGSVMTTIIFISDNGKWGIMKLKNPMTSHLCQQTR